MKTKYTPGPWAVNRSTTPQHETEIVTRAQGLYGTVALVIGRAGSETGEADANLIAAAPELLAALQDSIIAMETEQDGQNPIFDWALAKARRAIAKATHVSAARTGN